MNVTVSVTTGTRISVTSSGQRHISVASPSALTLAQVDTLYYPRSNPSGFATGVDNTTLVLRAETGQFYPSSNPSGFITSAQAGGIQSLNVSGSILSGAVVLTGIGGLIISKTGQTIYFSGGGSSSNLSNVVSITGNQTISGNKLFIGNLSSPAIFDSDQLLSINLTERQLIGNSAATVINWAEYQLIDSGINITVDWQNKMLTGTWDTQGLLISGQPVLTSLQTGSFITTGKVLNFTTILTSGIDFQFISFPVPLPTNALIVVCDFENNSDSFIYSHAVSSVSISGFTINFSDILSNTGYKLHTRVAM